MLCVNILSFPDCNVTLSCGQRSISQTQVDSTSIELGLCHVSVGSESRPKLHTDICDELRRCYLVTKVCWHVHVKPVSKSMDTWRRGRWQMKLPGNLKSRHLGSRVLPRHPVRTWSVLRPFYHRRTMSGERLWYLSTVWTNAQHPRATVTEKGQAAW